MTKMEVALKLFELIDEAARIAKEYMPEISHVSMFTHNDYVNVQCLKEVDGGNNTGESIDFVAIINSHRIKDKYYFDAQEDCDECNPNTTA